MIKMVLMHEPLGNHRLQHRQKMIPIAVDVEDDDRFLVKIELPPGGDLHGFVERAKPARKHHEGIAFGIHHFLALVHRVDDVKFGDTGMSDFDLIEKFRNDSRDMTTSINGAVGGAPHQSVAPAAIDNAHAKAGDKPAKFVGGVGECWVVTRGGAGKHADIFHV